MESGVAHWIQDMRSLQVNVLTAVRDGLRTDFAHAVAVLGISNLRLARKLTTMSVVDIKDLCAQMSPKLIVKLDESMAVEMLISNVLDPELDPAVIKMAALASSEAPVPSMIGELA